MEVVCRLVADQYMANALGTLYAAANEAVDEMCQVYAGGIMDNIDRDLSKGKKTGAWDSTEALRNSIDWQHDLSLDAEDWPWYSSPPTDTDVEIFIDRMEYFSEFEVPRIVGSFGNIYAEVHEFGKTIYAKNAPYMRFKIFDRWIMAKVVEIPERPFLRPAMHDRRLAKEALAAATKTLRHRMRKYLD